mmetsp:Transcript_2770/g.4320  ORF Transcript_2770/g.4320 Transcript_2770/m.4320 type:complete len:98 (+) Transcript_2770:389-682(+)
MRRSHFPRNAAGQPHSTPTTRTNQRTSTHRSCTKPSRLNSSPNKSPLNGKERKYDYTAECNMQLHEQPPLQSQSTTGARTSTESSTRPTNGAIMGDL